MFRIFGLEMYTSLYGVSIFCTVSTIHINFPQKIMFIFSVIGIDSHTVGNIFSIKVTGYFLKAVEKDQF